MKREQLLRLKAALIDLGANPLRAALSTDDAVELAGEMHPKEFRHQAVALEVPGGDVAEITVIDIINTYKELRAIEEPEAFEARLAYMQSVSRAAEGFWSAFQGQDVDGVEIVRKR